MSVCRHLVYLVYLVYMVSAACARPDLVVLLECFVVCVCVCVVSQC